MEGIGIWIFLALFYLLQMLTKRKQKQQRQQQPKAPRPKPQPRTTAPQQHRGGRPQKQVPNKPQKPISLEDLFNPDKLRDILGVPQPKPAKEPQHHPQRSKPQTVTMSKSKQQMHKRWEKPQQHKPSLKHEPEVRETGSRVAPVDITDVDESAARFKGNRLGKSDVTSDYFDERKAAPGTKRSTKTINYFDDPADIRHAIILKEILDRPRAFRRNIR